MQNYTGAKGTNMKKIVVVGLGYVGLSLAVLLAQHNSVIALDVVKSKVDMINKKQSPINDRYIIEYLKKPEIRIDARFDAKGAFESANFIIIATPTNYDSETNSFDTSTVENVIESIALSGSKATIVIKSTIPIGFTSKIIAKYKSLNLVFSPEFLREGKALEDNLYPSRIIIGIAKDSSKLYEEAICFGDMLNEGAIKKAKVIIMKSTEAEAVKLFANTFLATRVSFFNELDTYAEINGLDSSSIIHGMCMDPRIGDFYNNPSFGYGGYCLPKDTKQLKAEFSGVPNNIVTATVEANVTRSNYCAGKILDLASKRDKNPVIGIYRLIMKADSDNFRSSATENIIKILIQSKIALLIYEPTLVQDEFYGIPVVKDFNDFANKSTIIVANRRDETLKTIDSSKIYTRDIYGNN
jgi:UDPglucose 6-dehydrogenase